MTTRPRIAAVVVLALLSAVCKAQPSFPPGSLAYVGVEQVDGVGDSAAGLLGEAVGRGMEALLGDADTARAMGALAAEATRRHAAWSLCVMDYVARPDRKARNIVALHAVFVVEAPADTTPYATILAPLQPAGDRAAITEHGFRSGFDRGEPWQRIEWAPFAQWLVVGFGAGAVDLWKERDPKDPDGWSACSAALGDAEDRPLVVWLNLNALRRAMPEGFSEAPAGRLLAACGVANGRALMLTVTPQAHTKNEPAIYAAALACSARSDSLEAAHRIDLTEQSSPEGLSYPDGAAWAIAIRAGWGDWIEEVLNAWQNSGDDQQKARQVRRNAWIRDHGGALAGLIRMSGPYVIISGGDRGLELRCEFTGDVNRFDAYARGVFGFLGLPRFDPVARVWRWPLGGSGLQWGVQGRILVAQPIEPAPR